MRLALLLVLLLPALARAQNPPMIQELWQFGDTLCPPGDAARRKAAGSGWECFTPGAGGAGTVTDVGDCNGPACFTGTEGNSLIFEGSSVDANDTTLSTINPTAPRTINLPNQSGTICVSGNSCTGYGTLSSFDIDGDTGPAQTVDDAETVLITGGDGLDTRAQATNEIVIQTDSTEPDFLATAPAACGAGLGGKIGSSGASGVMTYCDQTAGENIRYLAFGDTTGAALTGDSANGFFVTGTLNTVNGGTGLDTSGSQGIPIITAGTWSVPPTSASWAAVLSDENGTGAVSLTDSPIFTTQIISPIVYGGTAADGDIGIGSTSDADKGSIDINPGMTTLDDVTALMAFGPNISFANANALLYAFQVGNEESSPATWTINQDMTSGTAGGLLFAFIPTITNEGTETLANGGSWAALYVRPNLTCNTGGVATCAYPYLRGMTFTPLYNRTTSNVNPSTIIGESIAVFDQPTINAQSRITDRYVISAGDKTSTSGSGTQDNFYGLSVADQTVNGTAQVVYTNMAAASGKYVVNAIGTAQSVHAGPFAIGGTSTTNLATYDLDVQGKAGVTQGAAADIAAVGGQISAITTKVGTAAAGGTGEQNLINHTMTASTLGANADHIDFNMAGTIANTVGTKTLRIYLGTTALVSSGALAASTAFDWTARGMCFRDTSSTTEKCTATIIAMTAAGVTTTVTDYTAPTENLATNLAVKMTGQTSTSSAADDIKQDVLDVRWYPANT